MVHSVTAGFDGTPASLSAALWAAGEAAERGVPLRLVEVREPGADSRTPVVNARPAGGRAREAADAAMKKIAGRHPEVSIGWEIHSGQPAHVFAALSADSALLVLGSHGRGSLRGFATGGAALSTLAHARCPVVLVRADGAAGGRGPVGDPVRVPAGVPTGVPTGVPADATAHGRPVVLGMKSYRPSEDLLAFAFETAARSSAPLHAVHAWELPAGYGLDPVPYGTDVIGEVTEERGLALAAALQPWQEKFPEVTVETRALVGRPADLLAGAAPDATLAVVGLRRRSSRFGAHIGPTTHAVLRHSHAPVAVVPHD